MSDATELESVKILLAAISNRRSMGVSSVDPDKQVGLHLVEKVLIAADWAPSHGETEPWRFTVYMGDSRHELGDAFAEAYKADTVEDSFKQNVYEANRGRAFHAPVWISIGMTPAILPDGSLKMTEEEELMAVSCAVQNLHLVANAQGLAGMWLSKGVFVHPRVAEFVGLQAPSRLLGFFFLGWPTKPWPAGERRPISEKVTWANSSK